jgi:phosphate starvation-inducible membrane PsiE
LSNLKHIDFVYQTHSGGVNTLKVSRETTPNSLIANASTYATHLKPYTMRNQAVNFQTEISKACSDWVVYYSSVTEVWGFFLFFYFIALFFFFYFIVPKSIPHYRLNTNSATPVS